MAIQGKIKHDIGFFSFPNEKKVCVYSAAIGKMNFYPEAHDREGQKDNENPNS